MTIPPYLKKGDKIGLLSTARKISPEQIQPAIQLMEDWGLNVVVGNSIGAEENQFAGSDELRKKNLQQFLDDTSVRAILCAGGGYGTMRIIDQIDFSTFVKHPKWIAGFSDITTLHSHIYSNYQIASIHSSMPNVFPEDLQNSEVTESLRKALFGEELSYEFDTNRFYKEGNVKGVITGGNLSLLFALQGSKSDIHTQDKILFIEDLDEYLYHIDRMIVSMDRSGKLAGLKALIVGGMTKMRDNSVPFGKNAEEIIWEHVSKYNYPVCFNFPAGHIKENMAIRLGAECSLNINKQKITFNQKANS
jgi:muramoyltetrapeptide carboxypeptidase